MILCSHSGGTKETLDAAELGLSKNAAVVMMTNHPGSLADSDKWISWVYPWGDNLKTGEIPSGISLSLAAELLAAQETFEAYGVLMEGIEKMDEIVAKAKVRVREELCDRFAQLCTEHLFLYILGKRCQLQPDLWLCHLQSDGDASGSTVLISTAANIFMGHLK